MRNSGSSINIVKINNYNIKNLIKGNNTKKKSLFSNDKNNTKNNYKKIKNQTSNHYGSSKDTFHIKTNSKVKHDKINLAYNNLNDEELNSLEYDLAILVDKRTYFQYYWSLLKKKQLILFTFMPANDYNLFTIKLSLFLLSFSLYLTINGFFFSDDTMHKIHEDNGKFNIIYQIPQILYSTIISAIINMILKLISLSERNIIAIKQIKDIKMMINYSKKIKRCITIKFILFFILNISFLLFFWYFISCFCGVYKNTQMILIKDTLVSFVISMIYPFGLNLLPGIMRIPALRAKQKDKKCLYKISILVAIF